jgi:hypothetical protein
MSGPDQRVELAREYLTDVSRRGVEQLPPTVLAREVAELRRLLGQVLAILGERQAEAQAAGTGGPFGTEREARAASLWEQQGRPEVQGRPAIREANVAQLRDACADAGVQLGAYDSRILHWLAGWEPAICAVVAGLIARAHENGSNR